jgi:hypothetical protein
MDGASMDTGGDDAPFDFEFSVRAIGIDVGHGLTERFINRIVGIIDLGLRVGSLETDL